MIHLTATAKMPVDKGNRVVKLDVDIAVEEDTPTQAAEALANSIRLVELGGVDKTEGDG